MLRMTNIEVGHTTPPTGEEIIDTCKVASRNSTDAYRVTYAMKESPLVDLGFGDIMGRHQAAAFLETVSTNPEMIENWSMLADAMGRIACNSDSEDYFGDLIESFSVPDVTDEVTESDAMQLLATLSERGAYGMWLPSEEELWLDATYEATGQYGDASKFESMQTLEEMEDEASEDVRRFGKSVLRLMPEEHVETVRSRLEELAEAKEKR